MAKIQSVEPNIADLANGWMKSYKLDYKLEQESLNAEIDQALNDYYSKNGGVGGNRPDAKLLLQDKNLTNYPILIEYKGYKDMSGTTNAGVVNYISNPVASFPRNAITIDIFGNTFYRDYAFGAGDDTGVYWNDIER